MDSIKPREQVFYQSGTTEYHAPKVIVATGGLSYPGTGSTGDGYKWAKSLGHNIILLVGLVPLVAQEVDPSPRLA